jgi:ribonuclease HI
MGGLFLTQPIVDCDPDSLKAGTDGSGGPNSRDLRLVRVGWGAVLVNDSLEPVAWVSGGLEGPQTVPRAELQALCWLLAHTVGDITVAIDAHYVIKGFKRGPNAFHASHQDLWRQVWHKVQGRRGKIQIVWVKSHMTIDTAHEHGIEPWAFFANWVADDLAESASQRIALPETVLSLIQIGDALSWKIRSRLVAVGIAWAELDRSLLPDLDKPKKATKADVAIELSKGSRHNLVWTPSVVSCMICNTGVNKAKPIGEISDWLLGNCVSPSSKMHEVHFASNDQIHSSHKRAFYQGLHFCTACGAVKAQRSYNLAKPCVGASGRTARGSNNLVALAQGKLPNGVRKWPGL